MGSERYVDDGDLGELLPAWRFGDLRPVLENRGWFRGYPCSCFFEKKTGIIPVQDGLEAPAANSLRLHERHHRKTEEIG